MIGGRVWCLAAAATNHCLLSLSCITALLLFSPFQVVAEPVGYNQAVVRGEMSYDAHVWRCFDADFDAVAWGSLSVGFEQTCSRMMLVYMIEADDIVSSDQLEEGNDYR